MLISNYLIRSAWLQNCLNLKYFFMAWLLNLLLYNLTTLLHFVAIKLLNFGAACEKLILTFWKLGQVVFNLINLLSYIINHTNDFQ